MPPADTAPAITPRGAVPVAPAPAVVQGWGGGAGAPVSLLAPDGVDALRDAVAAGRSALVGEGRSAVWSGPTPAGMIARGLGRSYGDAAQLSGGLVLDITRLNRFELDDPQGIVTAQAGVTVGELLRALAPAGWVMPVVPGTQHVTVGGAIASDIHGKNHGTAGTFGSHVRALGLLSTAGEVLELEPGPDDQLLGATPGGVGL